MTAAQAEALHSSVYEKLRQQIVQGRLQPESRIVESRLAKEMKVSRTPLREALFRLEQDGLVRSEVNRGFLVQGLSAREAREVYPIIWTLEAQALESSGGLAFAQSFELQQLNARFKRAGTNSRKSQELDTLWHRALIEKCPNRFLIQLIEKLRATIQRYEFVFMRDAALVGASVKQHEAVITALRRQDMPGAVAALIENWRAGLRNLLLLLGETH